MEFKGTKAPWYIKKEFVTPITVRNVALGEWLHNSIYIKEWSGRNIARVDYSTDTPNMGWGDNETIEKWEANALLISKAPEMLEMLQSLENDNGSIPELMWNKIKQLIKEATTI
jgi:hypothetical protein